MILRQKVRATYFSSVGQISSFVTHHYRFLAWRSIYFVNLKFKEKRKDSDGEGEEEKKKKKKTKEKKKKNRTQLIKIQK